MDPLSQGLLGAVAAQSAARKEDARLASASGALSALLADADVFISSSEDPLLFIDYHRHFTHSLLFIPIGGLIAAGILWVFLRKRLAFRPILLFALLGYATAAPLDACTSYGTCLLWPFSGMRVAFDIIAIIDPLFTTVLLVAVVVALKRRSALVARIGIAFSLAYLLLGVVQHERVRAAQTELAQSRGHRIERARVMPSIGNLLLWRSVYERKGMLQADAIRVGLFGGTIVYPGELRGRFRSSDLDSTIRDDSLLRADIDRFRRFADDFLVILPHDPPVASDFRYSMLPNGTLSHWGIEIDRTEQGRHAPFRRYGAITQERWDRFWAMVRGRAPDAVLSLPAPQEEQFAIVGYLPHYRMASTSADGTAPGLTDVIFFSLEPDAGGALDRSRLTPERMDGLRTLRNRLGVRLLLAVGGWGRSSAFGPMVADRAARAAFVRKVTRLCLDEGFNGVDFDWEYPANGAERRDYAALLAETKHAFGPHGLRVTAALEPRTALSSAQLESVDAIHLMSYDHGGRHSTFEQAVKDVERLVSKGVPRAKICLGVPFYARKTDQSREATTFGAIVRRFGPDRGDDEAGGYFFNGPETVGKKTRYALEEGLAGIMIWELGQDATGEMSLLRAITEAASQALEASQ